MHKGDLIAIALLSLGIVVASLALAYFGGTHVVVQW